jgi:hypothetical protein
VITIWILMAVVGFATTVLGFFMLGWEELKGTVAGGPYVVFGLLALPFAHQISALSSGWGALLYGIGGFSILFGLGVLAFERLAKGWFVFRHIVVALFWLVLAVAVPDVTSSMRMFPALVGLAYISIALATHNARRLTGGYVGFDVALNGMCYLFLGILLACVPDFFTHVGPSIWTS